MLAALQNKEFLYEQSAFPEVEYSFKHALTQEVAYSSVLIEQRKVLHERTAQAIEGLYHSKLEDHYSDLAHHYSRSSNIPKAVEYLHLAGQQAVQRSAYGEAIEHLTAALELLTALPETTERARQELLLRTTLGPALMATKGWSAPEVEVTYTRARDLCEQVGDRAQLFQVLLGLRLFYNVRAEFQKVRQLSEQLLTFAQREQDPARLLEAHRSLGTTLFWLGELTTAQAHLTQGLAWYDPQQHRSHALLYGQDPRIACLTYAAWILWFQGYPEQAQQKNNEALRFARELTHPYSLAWTLGLAACLAQFCQEKRLTQEYAEAVITLSHEYGFLGWAAYGTILRGWALAEQGRGKEKLAQIHQGLAAYRTTGSVQVQPYFLALLAATYGEVGQAEKGLGVLAEAMAIMDKTGERFYEAELYRLKGELTLQTSIQSLESRVKEAEACFQKAIEIARKQSAKSLELRAVMSLARLWQQQGKKAEAHQLLAEIYTWFTEGFDTKDLQEAKALLDELAEAR